MEGKVALVTGSTSGFGLGIANQLAAKGCSIILTGLGSQELIDSIVNDFKSKYTSRVDFVPVDLRMAESVQGFLFLCLKAAVKSRTIYNAPVEELPLDKWNDVMAVSVTSPFLLIKHFLPGMKKKGWGRIINMSSQMGVISLAGRSAYCASRSGLIGLSRCVALEAAPYGITCNAICPGFANAPMSHGLIRDYANKNNLTFDEAMQVFVEKNNPTKKPVEINEICGLVEFLCSSSACNMTGAPILVDAGFTSQ
ncbi:D-beta-hydroxybutyrate dehydrogenase-like [Haliotis rubra]|uniref:D-beta-hydroxybutyrate dehydrogenase-like n=1 Tax=Haliotis rubra TaxID=36100 RepID=UPI001EE62383|nr:D-beta-hydroxybutyrate dehydrogenase-like [Haliotis rubra]